MPSNKKKRKPGSSRVRTFTSSGKLPIIFRTNPDDDITLKLMPHTELAEIREGRGTDESYWTVVNRLNWASTLAGMIEFSDDPAPTINAALDAMLSLSERCKRTGKYVLTGDELRAVGDGLNLCDDMHDATTRRQHRDALVKLMNALPNN